MIKKMHKGFTLIELMIVVAIIGILAAIAIPNFIKFQSRSKQSEAKANLKAMFTAQKAFFAEKDRYSTDVAEVGFLPERNNRYAYFLTNTGTISDRSGSVESGTSGAGGVGVDTYKYVGAAQTYADSQCTTTPAQAAAGQFANGGVQHWMGIAIGNIDGDTDKDIWSISTMSRAFPATATPGTCTMIGPNPGGEPANDLNDV